MIISYGAPDYRVCHLKRKFEKFKIEILKIEKDFVEEEGYDKHHYIYLCQKLEGADEVSQKFFDQTIKELIEQQKIEEEEEDQDDDENESKDGKNAKNENENVNTNSKSNSGLLNKNEKICKQDNLGTGIKTEFNKIDKKENLLNGENKIISDFM